MAIFLRRDLIGFYEWPADCETNAPLNAPEGDKPFNRTCGFEVLYVIRILMAEQNLSSIEAGQEIEMMIKVAPTGLKTLQQIKNWILSN